MTLLLIRYQNSKHSSRARNKVEAEQGVLVDLKNAVLANVSDPDGYLDNELNLKRFLDGGLTSSDSPTVG